MAPLETFSSRTPRPLSLAPPVSDRARRTQVRRTFACQCVPNHVNPFDAIGSGEIFDEVDDSLLETGNRSHKDRS